MFKVETVALSGSRSQFHFLKLGVSKSMLKFTGDGRNGKTYFLGLNRGSLDRLANDQPIKVNLADMGGPNIDICILFGETDRLLFNTLKKGGLLPEDVEYREATPDMTEVVRIKREEKHE